MAAAGAVSGGSSLAVLTTGGMGCRRGFLRDGGGEEGGAGGDEVEPAPHRE